MPLGVALRGHRNGIMKMLKISSQDRATGQCKNYLMNVLRLPFLFFASAFSSTGGLVPSSTSTKV